MNEYTPIWPDFQEKKQKLGGYVFYKSVKQPLGEVIYESIWEVFCQKHFNPKALARKDAYPLFGNYIPKQQVFYNGKGEESNRIAESIQHYTMSVLDFDNDIPSNIIDIIKEGFPGITFLAYTTYNHSQLNPKWRVVFPFTEPVAPKDYPIIQKNIVTHLSLNADKCSFAQAHIFYYAAVKPGGVHLHHVEKGNLLDSKYWIESKQHEEFTKKSTEEYANVKNIGDILKEDFKEWFIPTTDPNRFLAVGSESKSPGVVIKGGLVYINHYQAMPSLAGRYLNISDLAIALKFNNNIAKTEQWLKEKGIKATVKPRELNFREGMNPLQKVVVIVKQHPILKGLLAWNSFNDKMILERDYVNSEKNRLGKKGQSLKNESLQSIYNFIMAEFGVKASPDRILGVLIEDSFNREFNEVEDWITGTTWDGESRLDFFWEKAGVPSHLLNNSFIKVSLKKWMVGNCAMIFDKEKKAFDGFLLLVGDTGTGKSHIAHCFGHKWEYCTRLANLHSYNAKDEYINYNDAIVINFDEFETFTKEDDRVIKMLTTQLKFTYRSPYARVPGDHYRKWGYMGTSNTMEIIKDPAISRRLWVIPIETNHMEEEKSRFMNTMSDPKFRQQLWAEAYALYKSCYDYQLTLKEIQDKELVNEQYKEENTTKSAVLQVLCTNDNIVAVDEVLEFIYPGEVPRLNKSNLNEKRKEIRNACRELGLTVDEKATSHKGKTARLWRAKDQKLYIELQKKFAEINDNT